MAEICGRCGQPLLHILQKEAAFRRKCGSAYPKVLYGVSGNGHLLRSVEIEEGFGVLTDLERKADD